jgi:hypothetical protein
LPEVLLLLVGGEFYVKANQGLPGKVLTVMGGKDDQTIQFF